MVIGLLLFFVSSVACAFSFNVLSPHRFSFVASTWRASAGMGLASMQAANLESVPKEKSGTASGIYSTFRYMGGMMASAMVSLLAGTVHLYTVLLIFAIVGLIVSVGFTMRSRVRKETPLAG